MKKIFRSIVAVIFLSATLAACDNSVTSSDCPPENRTGAICNDGTTSSATGSGACSGHGGVKEWICN